jgi:hypothetical protein
MHMPLCFTSTNFLILLVESNNRFGIFSPHRLVYEHFVVYIFVRGHFIHFIAGPFLFFFFFPSTDISDIFLAKLYVHCAYTTHASFVFSDGVVIAYDTNMETKNNFSLLFYCLRRKKNYICYYKTVLI